MCIKNYILCRNKRQCIPYANFCDGKYDCYDKSDEEHCKIIVPGTLINKPKGIRHFILLLSSLFVYCI